MKNENWLSDLLSGTALSERDKRLLKIAHTTLMNNIYIGENHPWKGIHGISPSRKKFAGIWNWDSAFIGRTVSRWDTELAKEQCRIFFNAQDENGQFPDVIRFNGEVVANYSKPPVFPWAYVTIYKRDGDRDFLKTAYEVYKKNENWWREYRRARGAELFHYDCNNPGHEKAEIYIGYESGWDNSVRWDIYPSDLWAIDLNCYMVMFYEAMEFMAKELSLSEEAKLWSERRSRLAELINEKMFDKRLGAYVDVNRFTGEYSPVLTPASFMPLYCGIAPKEYAEAMEKIAKEHFMPAMPTVAYTDPEHNPELYWRGPIWLNVAYFAAKGLKNYGFDDTADTLKENLLNICNMDDTFYENYNSKTYKGLYGPEFSWSSAFVIEFILDF